MQRIPVNHFKTIGLTLCAVVALWGIPSACQAQGTPRKDPNGAAKHESPLANIHSWGIQLQGLEAYGAVERLVAARYDLLVIEATSSVRGQEHFATEGLVKLLHASPGETTEHKRVLAYVNVGQAEDYRRYWKADWRVASTYQPGSPKFLLGNDPEGWEGNYPVAFWDPEWQAVLFGSRRALVDEALRQGFDGIFMDWVLGYGDPMVVEAAKKAGVEPAKAMIEMLGRLRSYARTKNPNFVMVAQNAGWLFEIDDSILEVIDGISHESLSYSGKASSDWEDPNGGGIVMPTEERDGLAATIRALVARGMPVLTLDYTKDPAERRQAETFSRSLGAIPFVSRTSLDRLPDGAL